MTTLHVKSNTFLSTITFYVHLRLVCVGLTGLLASMAHAQVLPTGGVIDLSALNTNTSTGTAGLVINGIDPFDNSGLAVSSAGDVNGDGVDDLLIGAVGAVVNGNFSVGETYVIFGSDSGVVGIGGVIDLSALNTNTPTGTAGLLINGIDQFDDSGQSVSSAGDINGDGFADVLIGANSADPNSNSDAGESYVIFGSNSGVVGNGGVIDLSALNTNTPTGTQGLVFNGIDPSDGSGFSISSAGDINGDGFDDVLIGTNSADPNGNSDAGESYVIFGSDSGVMGVGGVIDLSALNTNTPTSTAGLVINGIDPDDRSGFSVNSAGDINGDGFDDVLIGALLADPNDNSAAGKSYVIFGSDSGVVASGGVIDLSALNTSTPTGTPGLVINGIDPFDTSGRSVSSAGDVNGDGFDDVLIGAQGADPNGISDAGESYVIFGSNSGVVANGGEIDLSALNTSTPTGTAGLVINGINVRDFSGFFVSSAGDVNSDGFDDVLIGADDADPNGNFGAGETYVIFGNDSGVVANGGVIDLSSLNTNTPTGTAGLVINGIDEGDSSGVSVSSAGDVNGDGFDDVLIGANSADPNGNDSAGETYVVFGGVFNFAPVNTIPGPQSTNEDTVLMFNGNLSVSDADDDVLTVILSLSNGIPGPDIGVLTVATGGGATVSGNDTDSVMIVGAPSEVNAALNELIFTPAVNLNGSFILTVETDDGTAAVVEDTVAITVFAVNDAPSFAVGPNQVVDDNSGLQEIDLWATAISTGPADELGQTLIFNVVGNTNPSILTAAPTISEIGTLSFEPMIDAQGTTSISVVLMDDGGTANGGVDASAAQTFEITVNATNADLALTITNSAITPLLPGNNYSYELIIINNGPGIAANTLVDVSTPNNIVLISNGGCISDNGDGTLTWNAGTLDSGMNDQCVFDVEVLFPGVITLTGSASSDLNDPLLDNNTAITNTIVAEVIEVPTLSLWALVLLAALLGSVGVRRRARQ